MAAKNSKGYLGLSRTASLVLAIIPVTSIILGILTRLKEDRLVAGIIRIIPILYPFFWIIDLVCMITEERIWETC
jgi:hypothetical protein